VERENLKKMKFAMFWEWVKTDEETKRVKTEQMLKEMKDNGKKYGKFVRLQDGSALNFVMIGQNKGFNVWEADNEEQLHNLSLLGNPELKVKIIPVRKPLWTKEV
jgi:hypothetical protein